MKKIFLAALSVAFVLGLSLNVSADITWSNGVTLTGSSNVNTTGTLGVAANLTTDGGPSPNVNGVTFVPGGLPLVTTGPGGESVTFTTNNGEPASRNNQGAFNTGGFDGPDADLGTLIAGGSFNLTSVTFSNLTVGDDYLIQTFVHDGRNSRANAVTAYSNGVSTGVDPDSFTQLNEGGVGSFTIGTFTADATTLGFSVFGDADETNGVDFQLSQSASAINAIQLRNVTAVPEPSSLAVVGMMTIGLISRRRRK